MKQTKRTRITIKNVALLFLIIGIFLTGCNKKKVLEQPYKSEDIIEVLVNDEKELALVLENGEYVFYDKTTFEKVEITEVLQVIIDKYKNGESDDNPNSEEQTDVLSEPEDKNSETATSKPSEGTTKPGEPSKPTEPVKPSDKVTYGKIEYVDTVIKFKILESKADSTKELGTNGVLIKGVNGVSRKEVRKVYVNGKYSHTETVKNAYTFKKPVDQQPWHGIKPKPVDTGKYREDYSKEVIKLVNAERVKLGLNEYKTGHSDVKSSAKLRAKEIYSDYTHNSPNRKYSEAIYKNIGFTPKQAVDGWLKSEGHRIILLNEVARYADVGVWEQEGWICFVFSIKS